jgi:hypothetical protein
MKAAKDKAPKKASNATVFDFSEGEDVAETNAARRGAVKSVGAIAKRKAAVNSSEEVNDGAAKEGSNKKRTVRVGQQYVRVSNRVADSTTVPAQ